MVFKNKPEEHIRQALIKYMVDELGYDKSLLVVEKGIDLLPHLDKNIPGQRRVDLLYFAKGIHPKWDLYPLLLIECKAGKITKQAFDQVIGYNYHIKAYFVALANGVEIKTYCNGKEVLFLPSCEELIQAAKQVVNGSFN